VVNRPEAGRDVLDTPDALDTTRPTEDIVIRKLTLAAGFAAGYVLGAKAGTQRYEQIMAKGRELAGMPAVQELSTNVQQTASTVADKAKDTVNEKVSAVADKASSSATPAAKSSSSTSAKATATTPPPAVVDLATGADTGAAPMAGAAASSTAPITPGR
jgi:cytoskeletal protein RodZ